MITGRPFDAGVLQPLHARLAALVHVVELDLAEVPVPGVDQRLELQRAAVEGEAHVADRAAGLLPGHPFLQAQRAQPFKALGVVHHVHQVVVHVVRLEAPELLVEEGVEVLRLLHPVLGQLRGDVQLIPTAVFLYEPPQRLLAAGIGPGRVEVVHAQLQRPLELPVGLLLVDAAALARKPHAPEPQRRQLRPVPRIRPVLHNLASRVVFNIITDVERESNIGSELRWLWFMQDGGDREQGTGIAWLRSGGNAPPAGEYASIRCCSLRKMRGSGHPFSLFPFPFCLFPHSLFPLPRLHHQSY